jgi:OmpA-OmpF porin, OOP family
MKSNVWVLLAAISLSSGSAPAAEPVEGRWELGPVLGAGFPDDYGRADLDDINLILGGRLGRFFTEQFSLEGAYQCLFSETSGGGWAPMNSIRVNALWNFRAGEKFRPFVTVGGGMERIGDGISMWDAAPNLGLGARWMPFERSGFRLDGRYVPVKVEKTGVVNGWQHNLEATVSWFFLLGKKAQREAVAPVAVAEAPQVPVEIDSDGDGVVDAADRCSDTSAGTEVDPMGCPKENKARGVLKGVTFKSGSATLTDESKTILDDVVRTLNDFRGVSIEVQGHTDRTGNPKKNQTLSEERAKSVRDYLVSKGAVARLKPRGYGDQKPVADNRTPAGRQQNRRVELTWLDR